MSELSQKLLSLLENEGFCYHSLRHIAKECSAFLANSTDEDNRASDVVAAFVISRGCLDVAGRLDVGPVTTAAHEQIVKAVRPSLEAAIRSLGNADLVEKVTALSRLITAVKRAPSAEAH